MSIEVHGGSGFGREVRLGLVLYGGVSLAIYMNGTTNELFRAVRGRGVYWLIKHLIDADIGVDVASGASAGGINGVFLSFALANECEFGTCAGLWRKHGDLGTLLREVGKVGAPVPSVLDSDRYRALLENAFEEMWNTPIRGAVRIEPEAATPTPEIDLFVTGTDFYGQISNEVDAAGRLVEVKQHRTLFLLKHRDRAGGKRQLHPLADARGVVPENALDAARASVPAEAFRAFAKLAQITSCFPGAFAPVRVEFPHVARGAEAKADEKLALWGKLSAGEHFFVDGGVLDNKPFTSTLDAIFHRVADRKICRHLLYLEPDPERFSTDAESEAEGEDGAPTQPTFVASVLDSVTRLPSYESISDDLRRVAEHNASVQRFNALVDGLSQPAGQAAAPNPVYEGARLLGIGHRVQAELAAAYSARASEQPEQPAASGNAELLREMLAELGRTIATMTGDERHDLLTQVDVDFYIRRLMALTYELEPRSDEEPYRKLWRYVNEELQLLEIVRSAIERAAVPRAFAEASPYAHADKLWDEILRRALTVISYQGLEGLLPERPSFDDVNVRERPTEVGRRRAELKAELQRRIGLLDASEGHAVPQGPSLLVVSERRLRSLLEQADCVSDFLTRFERQDAIRYPLELASGVHERDIMHVVRLSPHDAQRGLSRRSIEDKICGETFGHFGAFLKKSWRSNDILWGRLDGICTLTETLLELTSFERTKAAALRLDKLNRALDERPEGRRAFLGQLFPSLNARIAKPDQDDPLGKLSAFLERPTVDRRELVELLIETAQLDALFEDLPNVIEDAAEEQLRWSQLKERPLRKSKRKPAPAKQGRPPIPLGQTVPASFWSEPWQFRTTGMFFDPSLLNLATRRFAREAVAGMSPEAIKDFFLRDYAVGSESAFLAMPRIVLVDLGARATALVEGALSSSAGRFGSAIRETWLYRWLVSGTLHASVALAGFLRTSPHYIHAFVIGAMFYGFLALTANAFWYDTLYAKDGFRRSLAVALFAVGPLVALTFGWLLWRPGFFKRAFVLVLLGLAGFGLVEVWPEIFAAACSVCKDTSPDAP